MGFVKHNLNANDVVAPSANAPIRFKELVVEPDRILYGDRSYSFDQIKRVGFEWIDYNKLGMHNHAMTLRFDLPGRAKPIVLKTTGMIMQFHFFQSIKEKHSALFSAYRFIASRSFPYRLQDYTTGLHGRGYCDAGDVRVFANRTVEYRGSVINLTDPDVKLSSYGGQITLYGAGGVRTSVFEKLFGGSGIISFGEVDTDVIYHLLINLGAHQ